jgi:hypothetical protein
LSTPPPDIFISYAREDVGWVRPTRSVESEWVLAEADQGKRGVC